MVLTLHYVLYTVYGPLNKQKLSSCTSLADRYFITEEESVYRAVRTEPLYNTDYVSVFNP
jgi:hypothetical protein